MSSSTPNNPNAMTSEERARRIEILKRRRLAEEAQVRNRTAQGSSPQKASTGKRPPPLNPDGTPMTRAQYEEARKKALARKQAESSIKEAEGNRRQQQTQRAPSAAPRNASPTQALLRAQELEEPARTKDKLEVKIDPKTGKKYKIIPKVGKSGNMPALAVEDFDLDNLQGEADAFLGHLRVPPNQEEIEELKRRKRELEITQKAEQEEELKNIESKYGKEKLAWTHSEDKLEDNLETNVTKDKKSFFSKLFGK